MKMNSEQTVNRLFDDLTKAMSHVPMLSAPDVNNDSHYVKNTWMSIATYLESMITTHNHADLTFQTEKWKSLWQWYVKQAVYDWVLGCPLDDWQHTIIKLLLFPPLLPDYLRNNAEGGTEETDVQKADDREDQNQFAIFNRHRMIKEYDDLFLTTS